MNKKQKKKNGFYNKIPIKKNKIKAKQKLWKLIFSVTVLWSFNSYHQIPLSHPYICIFLLHLLLIGHQLSNRLVHLLTFLLTMCVFQHFIFLPYYNFDEIPYFSLFSDPNWILYIYKQLSLALLFLLIVVYFLIVFKLISMFCAPSKLHSLFPHVYWLSAFLICILFNYFHPIIICHLISFLMLSLVLNRCFLGLIPISHLFWGFFPECLKWTLLFCSISIHFLAYIEVFLIQAI